MLYIFDLDGTLISDYMNNLDKAYNEWHVLPGRRGKLNQLTMQGHTICIATNQGGVAFGYVTVDQVWAKFWQVKVELSIPAVRSNGDPMPQTMFVCCSDVRGLPPWNDPVDAARRKPSGAMLREAKAAHPREVAHGVLYVGDREEDRAAAQDAYVPFQWAHIFFGE